jgi:predicted cobalt transporter CbtA
MITSRRKPFIDVELIRRLMYWSMVIAGGVSLFNLIWGRARWLAAASFVLILLTLLLGAHKVQVNDFAANTPCIGLDWFILDLLGSALIFIFV